MCIICVGGVGIVAFVFFVSLVVQRKVSRFFGLSRRDIRSSSPEGFKGGPGGRDVGKAPVGGPGRRTAVRGSAWGVVVGGGCVIAALGGAADAPGGAKALRSGAHRS